MTAYRALMNVSWTLLAISMLGVLASTFAGAIALWVSIGVFAAAIGCGVAAIYIDTHADKDERCR